jgi:predicted nucleic acid-binding protein
MDEKIPRVIAESIGLKVIGSLAILYIAKKRGLIEEDFDEIVKQLRAKGVRFSDEVIERLKRKWTEL